MVHVSYRNAVSLDGDVHFSFDSVPQQWRKVGKGHARPLSVCQLLIAGVCVTNCTGSVSLSCVCVFVCVCVCLCVCVCMRVCPVSTQGTETEAAVG